MLWGLDFLNWWPMGQSVLFGLGGVPDSTLSTYSSGLAIELTVPGLGAYLETHWLTRAGLSLITMVVFLTILGTFRQMLITVDVKQPFDYANIRRVQFIILLIILEIFGLDYLRTKSMEPVKALFSQMNNSLIATDSSYQNADAYAYVLLLLLLTLLAVFRRGVALLQQQRELEKELYQKRKLEAVGTLASGIGHDFNNILTSIIGYAELAKSEQKTEDIHFSLDRVLDSSYRAKRLTQQIRAIGGQQQVAEQEELIDLKNEVNELLLSIAPTIPLNISVLKQFDQQSRYEIIADPTKIYQVLLNLCTNALQAMASEQGQLSIDIYDKNHGEQEGYCLSIKDSGCGMNKEQQEHIFEPYFTTKKQQGGTGLGLSLCYRIVEGFFGHITISSELNQGSCFNIWLPKAASKKNRVLKVTQNNRILLLDDDKSVLALVKRKLSGLGYMVTAFSDGNDALNTFSRSPDKFDLLISDLNMPQMTGVQFTEKVQAIVADKPVIIITGTPEQVDLSEGTGVINAVISKPIAFSELHSAILDAFVK